MDVYNVTMQHLKKGYVLDPPILSTVCYILETVLIYFTDWYLHTLIWYILYCLILGLLFSKTSQAHIQYFFLPSILHCFLQRHLAEFPGTSRIPGILWFLSKFGAFWMVFYQEKPYWPRKEHWFIHGAVIYNLTMRLNFLRLPLSAIPLK